MNRRHARAPRRVRGDIDSRTAILIVALVVGAIAYTLFAPPGWLFSSKPRPDPPPLKATVDAQRADPKEPNPPLYKWRDASGQWHITDRPPKDLPFEKVVVDQNANVLPTVIPEVPGKDEKKPDGK